MKKKNDPIPERLERKDGLTGCSPSYHNIERVRLCQGCYLATVDEMKRLRERIAELEDRLSRSIPR